MANEPQDPSRISKWALLISSLVTLGFLVAAAVRENVTAQWRDVQRDYRALLLAQARDAKSQSLAGALPIEIRQVTVPALNVVDRCVTCHLGIEDPRMAGAPQPHRQHPKGLLRSHRVEKFGCTVCHQGQGAALNFEDAKAHDRFWDYPLLPASHTEASCNSCHDPRALPKDAARKLVRGMDLFRERGCAACHKLDGKGGSLGPALDNVGLKTKHQFMRANLKGEQTVWNWISEHFRDPRALVPDSRMPAPALSPADNEALTIYMLSLRQRPLPEQYLAPDKIGEKYRKLHPETASGEALYGQYCASCHETGLYSRWSRQFQRFVPGIRNAAFLRTEDDQCLLVNIREGRPGTQMPGWGPKAGGLRQPEMEALVKYLRGSTPPIALPAAPARGDRTAGRALFGEQCAGCHGVNGEGGIAPALANPVFQSAATDAFIAYTILNGRENTPMPAFGRSGFGAPQVAGLLAHIRAWQPTEEKR